MHIYIVEDNSFYAELMSYDLLKNNHVVEIFDNAEDCINALKIKIPDFIILDFYLRDGVDGLAVLHALSSKDSANCKVIMLSSSQSETVKHLAKKGGADYFMTKSIDSSHEISRMINFS